MGKGDVRGQKIIGLRMSFLKGAIFILKVLVCC